MSDTNAADSVHAPCRPVESPRTGGTHACLQVLEEPLLAHECLIDFIAVSPEARGRGVGAALMRWAERTGAAILAEVEAAAVAAHGGVDMTLWVSGQRAGGYRRRVCGV